MEKGRVNFLIFFFGEGEVEGDGKNQGKGE